MNDSYLTIAGNVVGSPRLRLTKKGVPVTNFRVASTPRRYDADEQKWVDGDTLFVNVTCWRAMAENTAASLQKGQPVVATGRFYARAYTVDETVRISHELEATAVGHDLARGTSEFRKAFRPAGVVELPTDADGVPVDDSDRWIDVQTGEIHEEPATDAQAGTPADADADADADAAVAYAAAG